MAPRLVQVGPKLMAWADNEESDVKPTGTPCLRPLVDSSALIAEPDADQLLAKQFEKDGYLFIRGLLDRQTVLQARRY